jgi:hypothetical protein
MREALTQAKKILSDAETRLRQLITAAVADQRYDDVAKLAPVAQELVHVIATAGDGEAAPSQVQNPSAARPLDATPNNASSPASVRRRSEPLAATVTVSYPRFERQGDRLVKFAWSKKDRREYEHRATADVVFRIAELFEQRCGSGASFLMDALMPFKMADGVEIPSYQAYLALAWFRSFGAVESRGKDGYAVVSPQLQKHVRDTWDSLVDALRR